MGDRMDGENDRPACILPWRRAALRASWPSRKAQGSVATSRSGGREEGRRRCGWKEGAREAMEVWSLQISRYEAIDVHLSTRSPLPSSRRRRGDSAALLAEGTKRNNKDRRPTKEKRLRMKSGGRQGPAKGQYQRQQYLGWPPGGPSRSCRQCPSQRRALPARRAGSAGRGGGIESLSSNKIAAGRPRKN